MLPKLPTEQRFGLNFSHRLCRDVEGRGSDEICGVALVHEQRFNFAAQSLVTGAGFDQKRRPLALVPLQGRVIDSLDLLPSFRFHNSVTSDE